MEKFASVLLSGLLLVACGGNQARAKRPEAPAAPKEYTYAVRSVHPHPTTSYTQGLQFADGMLWEGTGEHGESVVQTLDLETGRTEVFARLPQEDFGEGITLLDGKLYQLTWQSNKAYVYDLETGKKIKEFRYPGEGWGLTTDGQKLYMSDGTANIYTLDPATFKREKRTTVTLKGIADQFPQRTGVDRRQVVGQRLHDRPDRHYRPGDGRGRRGRRPHGTVARRGGYAHDRRTRTASHTMPPGSASS